MCYSMDSHRRMKLTKDKFLGQIMLVLNCEAPGGEHFNMQQHMGKVSIKMS